MGWIDRKGGMWLITDILPVTHSKINTCWLHISSKWKGQTPEKDLPLMKYDITTILRPQKRVIYSRYRHNCRLVIWYCDITKISHIWYLFVIAGIKGVDNKKAASLVSRLGRRWPRHRLVESFFPKLSRRYHQKIEKPTAILSVSWPTDSWVRVLR